MELIENYFYSPLENRFSEETLQELTGLSDATGIDRRIVLRALLAPDIMQLLISGFLRGGKKGSGNYFIGGCSGAYVKGSAVKTHGKALLARNLDFSGALVWKYPAIIYNHPTENIDVLKKSVEGIWYFENKIKQPYMYFSTAGFPGTGLTGINASGITMSTFVCISKDSTRKATPSLDYNHFLFTRIESMEALPLILKDSHMVSAAPHTVLFADKNQAVCLELSSKKTFFRKMTEGFDSLVQTNHFLNPQLKKNEIEFPLERESTIERYRYLRDAIELQYGRLDPGKMVDIISSNYNRAISQASLTGGEFPAQPNTLMSVVIEPESGNFWMAQGKPPGICFNTYKGFNFFNEMDDNSNKKYVFSIKRSRNSVFNPGVSQNVHQKGIKSLRYFLLSSEQFKIGRMDKSLQLLKQAIEMYKDPGYYYVLAILYLMNQAPEESLNIISIMKSEYRFSRIKESIIPLWEGRCYDLLGRRRESLECYRKGLNISGLQDEIKKVYLRSLKKTFSLKQMPKTLYFNYLGPMKF
ncbi:MAG: hypothetical protein JEY91_13090 [Spirochaetaceae bacterium]|nr:hypothetical protein [Spirochaetaceae bacterium]